MTVDVYGYVSDGGDGSYSIRWFNAPLENYTDYVDGLSDGDGLSYRQKLTFESYEAAKAAGIKYLSNAADYADSKGDGDEEDDEPDV
jgi:hypothetical protein